MVTVSVTPEPRVTICRTVAPEPPPPPPACSVVPVAAPAPPTPPPAPRASIRYVPAAGVTDPDEVKTWENGSPWTCVEIAARLPVPADWVPTAAMSPAVPSSSTMPAVLVLAAPGSAPCTNAVVASFVLLSPPVWVVAEVPFGSAGVPERLAAVPLVFWFSVVMPGFGYVPVSTPPAAPIPAPPPADTAVSNEY